MRKLVVVAVLVLVGVTAIGAYSAAQNDTSEANVVPGTVCPTSTVNELVAQSVPSASLVPCVALFGGRWSVDGEDYTSDGTTVSMTGHNSAGVTWKVSLAETCDTSDMTAAPDSEGANVVQKETQTDASYMRAQVFSFYGGCVTSTVVIPSQFDRGLVLGDVDTALVLVPRSSLNEQVRAQTDGKIGLDP